jgi:hypothetical protein
MGSDNFDVSRRRLQIVVLLCSYRKLIKLIEDGDSDLTASLNKLPRRRLKTILFRLYGGTRT